ncbi:hypothetical protein DLAC_09372 [Tieghemostelium lacteum]|uniref:Uncharacterized protein n=1 Tax=Tieghemostelium lacteum TaxID=361077 RepID=A0A151Z9X2_TIELA|nr:hypothetical protein DLAC_09372 [Tieghemostelium lacteum]|eukprot:KYQ90735.1 hypothetical protein DLAC_09372 [Tieghemostelium lacteum]
MFFKDLKNNIGSLANDLEGKINKNINDTVLKLKTKVSKDKNRFVDGTFNLDLTYITNRIIAMGYPSPEDDESSLWRNSRKEVRDFLELYHPDHYLILNLTENTYDSTYFNGKVYHLGFMDHHPPSMGLLLHLIQIIHHWLTSDELNVVAIHCKAGRGRTGTVICSYLLSTELYEGQIEKVLEVFANLRSATGEGVSVPSQLRYIEYVNQLATKYRDISSIQNPHKYLLKSIIVNQVPNSGGKPWNPIIKIFNTTKPLEPVLLYCNKNDPINYNHGGVLYQFNNLLLCGDIIIKVYSSKGEILIQEFLKDFFDKSTIKFGFHTSFIDNNYLDLSKSQLDSGESFLSTNEFSPDFKLRLMFTPVIDTPPVGDEFTQQISNNNNQQQL